MICKESRIGQKGSKKEKPRAWSPGLKVGKRLASKLLALASLVAVAQVQPCYCDLSATSQRKGRRPKPTPQRRSPASVGRGASRSFQRKVALRSHQGRHYPPESSPREGAKRRCGVMSLEPMRCEPCSCSGDGRRGLLGLERSGHATYSDSGATLLANRKGSLWRTWCALPVGPYLGMRSGRMLVSSVRSVLALLDDQISPSDNDEAAS